MCFGELTPILPAKEVAHQALSCAYRSWWIIVRCSEGSVLVTSRPAFQTKWWESNVPCSSSVSTANSERINSNIYSQVCFQRRNEAAGPDKSNQPYLFDILPAETWCCSAGRAVELCGPAPSAGERPAGAACPGRGAGLGPAHSRTAQSPATAPAGSRPTDFVVGQSQARLPS